MSSDPNPGGRADLIHVATIGAGHGVRGAVTLRCYLAEAMDIGAYGPLLAKDGRAFKVRPVRLKGKALIAEIDGISDRNGADALRGVDLYITRDRLPAPDVDEFYHTDLIGLAARDHNGQVFGHIVAVQDFGGGDLLDIRLAGVKKTVFVPFTKAVVPTIDIAAGFVVIDAPPGLLDDPEDEASS